MTNARPRSRTMPIGALATATLLAVGLAIVPALPAAAAPPGASVGTEAALKAELLSSAGTSTTITLTANITSATGIAVSAASTVDLQLGGFTLDTTGTAGHAGIAVPSGASLMVAGAGTITATGGLEAAGIEVPSGASLTLAGTGTITAKGGNGATLTGAAGIGGSLNQVSGTITILSGTVKATGSSFGTGAGIGGGSGQSAGTTDIRGGTVTATGAPNGGAGIGGGRDGSGGLTTISGGVVTATGRYTGAGIGGGTNGAAGTIQISGGAVTSTGGGTVVPRGGSGIGTGGAYDLGTAKSGGTITISGSTTTTKVTAFGYGGGSAGIGGRGGSAGLTPMTIDISGGEVAATNGDGAAAIGGGNNEPGAAVTIGAAAVVKMLPHFTGVGTAIGGTGTAASQFGNLSNAGELRVTPGTTMTIPAGALVTNTGTLMGAGAIVNHGVIVTNNSMAGTAANLGTTLNDGVILNTGVYNRPESPLPSLTFNRNDGSTTATIMQLFAASLAAATADALAGPILNAVVQAPTRTGYTFAGWATTAAGGVLWTPATAITVSQTLYAQWTINDYAVTFNNHNGTADTSTIADHGTTIVAPTEPTRTGYTFNGWYREATGATAWNFTTDTITAATTLHALWTPNSYAVTFNSHGGSPVTNGTVTHDGLVAEPTPTPARAGYTFNGWFTEATDGTQWDFGTDAVTGATTLHAQWTPNAHTVTFNSHGGSPVIDGTATYDGLITEPSAAPTLTGYTFDGWFTEAADGTQWNFGTDTITGATTLHAQWTIKTYTVTFNSQGGSPVADGTATHNGLVLQPTAPPTRTSYTFAGWTTSTDGGIPWVFDTNRVAGPTTIYAKWTVKPVVPATVTVTFDTKSGSVVKPITALKGTPFTAPQAPTRAGYAFTGWFTDAAATKKWAWSTPATANLTLYAKWTVKPVVPATVTVTFDTKSGSVVKPITALKGKTFTAPKAPTRAGYTFKGWFTDAAVTKSWAWSTPASTNLTLYAGWTRNSTVITPTVKRVAGDDRYATAIAVSKLGYPKTAPVVYVATGSSFPDALAAAPAAAKLGGPLLLTTIDNVPETVKAEIKRLKPARIVVVGGTAVISDAVLKELSALQKNTVRLWGANRFQTANAIIADAFPGTVSESWLVTGTNFPDALSAAAVAGSRKVPVVLINGAQTGVDTATMNLFSKLKPAKITIAGGPAAVTPGIETSLKSDYTVSRLAGADRYSTSLAINANSFSKPKTVYLATGSGFADALAGAAVAGATNGPLYVIPSTCVPSEILAKITIWGSTKIVVIGGTAVLDGAVEKLVPCK